MVSEILKVLKTIFTLADDLQKYHAEIKEIRRQLYEFGVTLEGLKGRIDRIDEREITEREKLILQLQLEAAKLERLLPPTKKPRRKPAGKKVSKTGRKQSSSPFTENTSHRSIFYPHSSKPSTARCEHFFGGADAVIERLLKQCDAAQIGVREMNRAERLSRGAARSAPDEVRARADHRVSPTHHVNSFG